MTLRTDLGIDVLNISGSSVHLSKTVMILVHDALEATPEGGRVSISTENRFIDPTPDRWNPLRCGDCVVPTVADTGTGIEEADLPRIFGPFYTKKQMGRSGTGLGMAVGWGTVQDHEGHIEVDSEAGRGSTFELYFPAVRENVPPAEAPSQIEGFPVRATFWWWTTTRSRGASPGTSSSGWATG